MPEDEKKVANFSLNLKDISSIETQETNAGLLLKGLPVFKAGRHRGTPFSADYIDRNLIAQFDEKEDIPLQADHSPSFRDTLGFIKHLERKGDFLMADVMLVDENAIERWKKGLMKKFSAGIDLMKDKLREVSAVAFPFIKEAAVHTDSDYVIYEGSSSKLDANADADLHRVETSGKSGDKAKQVTVEIDGKKEVFTRDEKTNEELGLVISIEDDGSQFEALGISEDDIANLDVKKDFVNKQDLKEKDLPDSAFLLTKKPIKNKSTDRMFAVRNKDGKIVLSAVTNAREKLGKLKGFSDRTKVSAEKLLLQIESKFRNKKPVSELSDNKRTKKMTLKDVKLSEYDGEVKELLSEALENQETLEKEIESKQIALSEKSTEVENLNEKLKKADVDSKVEKLLNEGKITPAQKDQTSKLLMSMSAEQTVSYIDLMSDSKPVVELGESASEEHSEEETADDKLDIDNLDASEINRHAENLAEEHKVDFKEALDWVYDGKVSSNGKLIEESA